jgi:hypothetical protein
MRGKVSSRKQQGLMRKKESKEKKRYRNNVRVLVPHWSLTVVFSTLSFYGWDILLFGTIKTNKQKKSCFCFVSLPSIATTGVVMLLSTSQIPLPCFFVFFF